MATVALITPRERAKDTEGSLRLVRVKITINRNEVALIEIPKSVHGIDRVLEANGPGHCFIKSDKKTVVVGNYPTLLNYTIDDRQVTGLDDFSVSGTYTGTEPAYYTIQLTNAASSPDQFKWSKNGGTLSTATNITGGNQTLSDGVQIKFVAIDGHTLNDIWTVTAYPATTTFYVDIKGYGGM